MEDDANKTRRRYKDVLLRISELGNLIIEKILVGLAYIFGAIFVFTVLIAIMGVLVWLWDAYRSTMSAVLIILFGVVVIILGLWGIVKGNKWLSRKQAMERQALNEGIRENEKEFFDMIKSNTEALLEEKLI